jgi:hypothetical protein
MSQGSLANDELLSPPFAPGDTLMDLMRRLGGISPSGSANILPGWDWAMIMSGVKGAAGRYSSGLGVSDGIAARAAVGEALWWIAAADEFIRKRVSKEMSLAAYCREIQKTTAGRRLTGLVYLRNRAGHQLASVLMQPAASKSANFKVIQGDGTVKTETVTVRLDAHLKAFDTSPAEGYYFSRPSALPPPDAGFAERNLRDNCYDELVAGRSVANLLEATARSLDSVIAFDWTGGNVTVRVNGSGNLPGVQRSLNTKRRYKMRSPVYHNGTCTVNHRSPETAAKCRRTT